MELENYESKYPDVILSAISPAKHWEIIGSKLGRNCLALEKSNINNGPKRINNLLDKLHENSKANVAIFIHLYYRDIWSEIDKDGKVKAVVM
jgi:hypothetical protein